MKLSIGFSPCPNDTFIFDALVHKKIDTGDLDFEVVLEDVETLNEWALQGKLDITKLSFPAFFRSIEQYALLKSGSALGKGVGPLLIAKQPIKNDPAVIDNCKIVLPGINTTAHLLFSLAYPNAKNKSFQHFSTIEDAVLNDSADLGVIIHENRFTYKERGLNCVMDLGTNWEEKMKVPIPLGGIAIKRKYDSAMATKINTLISESLSYAWNNSNEVAPFVIEHAQTMSTAVMQSHIELYVNNFSLNLGTEGKSAVKELYNVFCTINGLSPSYTLQDIFYEQNHAQQ